MANDGDKASGGGTVVPQEVVAGEVTPALAPAPGETFTYWTGGENPRSVVFGLDEHGRTIGPNGAITPRPLVETDPPTEGGAA